MWPFGKWGCYPQFPTYHKVTSGESVQGYAIFEADTGAKDEVIEIENIAAKDGTTAQKFITIGYVPPEGGYVPVNSGQQANDVDQWITLDHRVICKAPKVYMRIEDPALNDLIYLIFTIAKRIEE